MSPRLLVLAAALALAGCASDLELSDPGTGIDLGLAPPEPLRPAPEVVDWSRPLSLEECQALADTRSPSAAAFSLRLANARASMLAAETWPNPTVNFQAQDIGEGPDALMQSTVSYPVLFGWTQGAQEDVARAARARTNSSVADDRRRLRLEVARAYYELVAAEELATLEAHSAELATELAELVERLVAGGERSPLDGRRARAEALETRGAMELATRRRDVQRLAFSLALGADRPQAVQVVRGWPGEVPQAGAEMVPEAIERRADVVAARAEVDRATAAVALEERRAIPLSQLIATAGTRQGSEQFSGFVGVSFPIPLFDRNQGARSRARAEEVNASTELAIARRRVALEVESALLAWERARAALETIRRPLVAERDALLDAMRRQVESGDTGPLELLQAQRDALTARRQLLGAELEAALEHARLVAALGLSDPDR